MNQTTQQTGRQGDNFESMGMDSQGLTGQESWSSDNENEKEKHSEGAVAKTIEEQTAKLPSDLFLWAAVGAMGVSAVMEFSGNKDKSRFFGQWVAPLLLFGVYNKLVKVQGSDRTEN